MSRSPQLIVPVTSGGGGGGVVEVELEGELEDDVGEGLVVVLVVDGVGSGGVVQGPSLRPILAEAVRSSRSPDSSTSLLRTVTSIRSSAG